MAAGADGRPSREDLDALADRLAEHERRRADEERRRRRRAASPYGFGFRLVTELVAGVAAGFLGGWALDRWLDASPWFVLLLTRRVGRRNELPHAGKRHKLGVEIAPKRR